MAAIAASNAALSTAHGGFEAPPQSMRASSAVTAPADAEASAASAATTAFCASTKAEAAVA
ncbi:MAG: hypothetical protein ABGW98_04270, partial [Myxococcales bacterium]